MRIIVTGLPRSGSTLLWQIINEIRTIKPNLMINLVREHGGANTELYDVIFITYRDIREIMVSLVNSHSNEDNEDLTFREKLIITLNNPTVNYYISEFEKLYELRINNPKIIAVKYENYLPTDIEGYIKYVTEDIIKLTYEEIKMISNKFSLKNNKLVMKSFEDFSQYDPKTMIHGNHITSNGEHDTWKKYFDSDLVEAINPKIKMLIKKLGYV